MPPKLAYSTMRTPTGWLSDSIEAGRTLGFVAFACAARQIPPESLSLGRALRGERLRLAAVHVSAPDPALARGDESGCWLTSTDGTGREEAIRGARLAADAGSALGARTVILRVGPIPRPDPSPGEGSLLAVAPAGGPPHADSREGRAALDRRHEEAVLDRVCRSLFELCRSRPEVTFCLAPPATSDEIPQRHHLDMILGDVRAPNLRYWHDPARCHRLERLGLGRHESWLDGIASRLHGMSLHDAAGNEAGLPPGTGEIDFALLGFYASGCERLALEVHPDWDPTAVREAVAFLRSRRVVSAAG